MKTLIITYLDEKYYENFKNDFVKTLAKNTNFDGDLIVLDYGLTREQKQNIRHFYSKIIFISCFKDKQIEAQRNFDILNVLKTTNYDVVMTIDAGDVWFQQPFNELFDICQQSIGYVEEKEKWTEDWSSLIIGRIYKKDIQQNIRDRLGNSQLKGSGMICGNTKDMIRLIEQITLENNMIGEYFFGTDQISFNLAIQALQNEIQFISLPSTYDYVIIKKLHNFSIDANQQIRDESNSIVKIVHNAGNPRFLPEGLEKKKLRVSAEVSTLGRYHTTLPFMLLSLTQQTIKPYEIIIFDDNPDDKIVDLRQDWMYQHIFRIIELNGIKWRVLYGGKKGQVFNHNMAIDSAEGELIWRLDDDVYYSKNALEEMLKVIENGDVAAVGGLVWHANGGIPPMDNDLKNKMSDIFLTLPIEWTRPASNELIEVEHLYSTFLFKKEVAIQAGRYFMGLSRVGHREETIFSHRLFRTGKKLIINPNIINYHLRNGEGGIRTFAPNKELWHHDEELFKNMFFKEWKYKISNTKLMVINNGLGDTIVFKKILPEIIEKHKDRRLVVVTNWPNLFKEFQNIECIGLQKASIKYSNLESYNVYRFMVEKNWNKTIEEAYREMYLK